MSMTYKTSECPHKKNENNGNPPAEHLGSCSVFYPVLQPTSWNPIIWGKSAESGIARDAITFTTGMHIFAAHLGGLIQKPNPIGQPEEWVQQLSHWDDHIREIM